MTVEQWPYEPEKRAKRLGLPDASEETFWAWSNKGRGIQHTGKCLGNSCRFYCDKPDAICFKQGILPECSPELKAERKKLDNAAPDLYEALNALYCAFQLDFKTPYSKVQNDALGNACTALAKAEGR